ncbi:hypothetical protein Tco_0711368 [Tanacetum coccineum]
MATLTESSSLGTTSGGGPRCQETMGDTIAQTRFENVSKHSNDSLLARGLDKSKITRKQSKTSKHGHENQKSTKPKPKEAKPQPKP